MYRDKERNFDNMAYNDPFEVRIQKEQLIAGELDTPETIQKQKDCLEDIPLLRFIVDSVPQLIMVLNEKRQLILGNKALQNLLLLDETESIQGKRPGDILGCIHAARSSQGCGSTQFCQYCGSFQVLMGSLIGGSHSEECRVIKEAEGHEEAMELRVSSAPFAHGGWKFIFFHIEDISQEKRKQALERIFFHDILNGVGGIKGMLELSAETADSEQKEFLGLALQQTESIIDEIQMQKSLTAAESHQLQVNFSQVHSLDVLKQISSTYSNHPVAQDKTVKIAQESENAALNTDPVLLSRVLGNMLKNALEASSKKETVNTGCVAREKSIIFWVQNSQVILEDVRMQIFKRSFSTKGKGRGLGTHSIKLLTEEYLHGKSWFVSNSENGTIFYVALPSN